MKVKIMELVERGIVVNEVEFDELVLEVEFNTIINPSPEVCLMAVKKCPGVIAYLSEDQKTEEMCDRIIEESASGIFLHHCTKLSLGKCMELVINDISNFETLPKYYKEVCEYAIKKNPLLLHYVPEEFQTPRICAYALSKNSRCITSIKNKSDENIAAINKCMEDLV